MCVNAYANTLHIMLEMLDYLSADLNLNLNSDMHFKSLIKKCNNLATSRRSPEDHVCEVVLFQQRAEEGVSAEYRLLANIGVQADWSHPLC